MQLVFLGIIPSHEEPSHTCCLALTREAVVNSAFLFGNINGATAGGTSHRSGWGSPSPPGVTPSLVLRVFSYPALGALEDAETLNLMVPVCQQKGACSGCTADFLWSCPWGAMAQAPGTCSDYGTETPLCRRRKQGVKPALVTPPQTWGVWSCKPEVPHRTRFETLESFQ